MALLLDKTERNLKRIERINDSFVCFALNEWRYATRHVVNFMRAGNPEEESKVVGHLKRAYFDSCDVLLDGLLNMVAQYEVQFGGYASLVAGIVPDFKEAYAKVWEAKELHLEARSFNEESRESRYDGLEPYCEALSEFVGNLGKSRDIWLREIRAQRRRDRMPVIWTAIGITVSIILAILFH